MKTAVDWLIDMLDIDTNDSATKELIQQAKEMEKQQIIDSFKKGQYFSDEFYNPDDNTSEAGTYYQETYGK
jgi:hypothetical protein